jgi:hypothetical protein
MPTHEINAALSDIDNALSALAKATSKIVENGICLTCGKAAKKVCGINRRVYSMKFRDGHVNICSECLSMLRRKNVYAGTDGKVYTWKYNYEHTILDDIPSNIFAEWLSFKLHKRANATS